ncbi:MAG: proteobacterial dedicated sortase system histidine kinase, partial [Gammaproteobacteria bacterium]|nr:proteobacterial dedicated sortase system histidine kinase [Gammaproteobacteria bacterium]
MKPTRRHFGLTVRTKVLLFSALLLTIPYEGYQYLREMEKYLRIGLENSLMGAARALAGAMHDRPALFEHSHRQPLESGDGLYLFNLEQPIQLDGY